MMHTTLTAANHKSANESRRSMSRRPRVRVPHCATFGAKRCVACEELATGETRLKLTFVDAAGPRVEREANNREVECPKPAEQWGSNGPGEATMERSLTQLKEAVLSTKHSPRGGNGGSTEH